MSTHIQPSPLHHEPATVPTSAKQRWTGRVLSGLAGALLLLDAATKFVKPGPVVGVMAQLGYQESAIVIVGTLLLVSTVLYLIPRTAIIGAVLLSAYLGGAVATNFRVNAPLFNILFPAFFGVAVWVGLGLRDNRIKYLFT